MTPIDFLVLATYCVASLQQPRVGEVLLDDGQNGGHREDDAEDQVERDEELVQAAVAGGEAGVEVEGEGHDAKGREEEEGAEEEAEVAVVAAVAVEEAAAEEVVAEEAAVQDPIRERFILAIINIRIGSLYLTSNIIKF